MSEQLNDEQKLDAILALALEKGWSGHRLLEKDTQELVEFESFAAILFSPDFIEILWLQSQLSQEEVIRLFMHTDSALWLSIVYDAFFADQGEEIRLKTGLKLSAIRDFILREYGEQFSIQIPNLLHKSEVVGKVEGKFYLDPMVAIAILDCQNAEEFKQHPLMKDRDTVGLGEKKFLALQEAVKAVEAQREQED